MYFGVNLGRCQIFGRGVWRRICMAMLVRVNFGVAGFKSLPIFHEFGDLRIFRMYRASRSSPVVSHATDQASRFPPGDSQRSILGRRLDFGVGNRAGVGRLPPINGILVRIRDEAGVPFPSSSVLLLMPAHALKCFSNIGSAWMLEDA